MHAVYSSAVTRISTRPHSASERLSFQTEHGRDISRIQIRGTLLNPDSDSSDVYFPSGKTDNSQTVEHKFPKCLGEEVGQVTLGFDVNQFDYTFRDLGTEKRKPYEDVLHSLVTGSFLT